MGSISTNRGWLAGLTLAAVVGASAAWGLNQALVWQLARHAPQPAAPVAVEPPAPPPPAPVVLAPDLVEEQPVADHAASTAPRASHKASRRHARPSRAHHAHHHTARSGPRRVFVVNRAQLKRQFRTPADLAGHGRIVPYTVNGHRRGLRFVDVAPAGIFARLGIQSGDVLVSVNGARIASQQDVLACYQKMHQMHAFDVVLQRHHHRVSYRYVVK